MIAARPIDNSKRYYTYCAGCANMVDPPVLEVTGIFCTLALCAPCAEAAMLLLQDILEEIDATEDS